MYRHNRTPELASTALIALAWTPLLLADPYDLSWHTVDGGGAMFSAGGDFELSGSIGQPDAGAPAAPMTGGEFELVGGFWVAGAVAECTCPGDLNGDHLIDGEDVQGFVNCLIGGAAGCACADIDGTDGVTVNDVTLFVNELLSATSCL